MKFKEFIGIDVSKSTIDVFLYHHNCHFQFGNCLTGFQQMIDWINQQTCFEFAEQEDVVLLFGFEHTGLYSLNLSLFFSEHHCPFVVLSGLEVKRSKGIQRGKSDKMDAKVIATYLYEKKEKLCVYQMPSSRLLHLKKLLSYRERLVKEHAAFQGRVGEYKQFLDENEYAFIFESHQRMMAYFKEEIQKVEAQLYKLIKEDAALNSQFELINSIKGVGPQTALTLIVLTHGFSIFETWRKFASYAGIAPFPNESGKFKGKSKISNLANKRIKALLTLCAASAIQCNPEMKQYYRRRLSEGKTEMSTLNIIRNKLLARVFAVVKRGTPYVEICNYAA